MAVRIITGDCRTALRELPDASVHCVVTSPPYYGLRDYGTASWDGGDSSCDHARAGTKISRSSTLRNDGRDHIGPYDHEKCAAVGYPFREVCSKCGARRVDRQIGLERTPAEYVEQMVEVFREVRRVLRDDGTCWLNLGDSYVSNGRYESDRSTYVGDLTKYDHRNPRVGARSIGLKPKDLIGIPWRVAFALQDDGWYLRSDIVWAKRNCMPESVRDRPTRAHEYLFLLTKSERYFYDATAIEEEGAIQAGTRAAKGSNVRSDLKEVNGRPPEYWEYNGRRNKRTVWWVATHPYPEAHFATFPPDLIEPCILAGASEKGCCAQCGAPWSRQIEHSVVPGPKAAKTFVVDDRDRGADRNDQGSNRQKDGHKPGYQSLNQTVGWLPSCKCDAAVIPCTVLDPFGGAGTTGLVADRLGRNAILVELNPTYCDMARRRLVGDAGMFAEVS